MWATAGGPPDGKPAHLQLVGEGGHVGGGVGDGAVRLGVEPP
jgi:hypothetical protein